MILLIEGMGGPPAPVKAILKQFSSGREEDKMSGYVIIITLFDLILFYFIYCASSITPMYRHVMSCDNISAYLIPYYII